MQLYSSHPHLVTASFRLLKVIVATAIHWQNMVQADIDGWQYPKGQTISWSMKFHCCIILTHNEMLASGSGRYQENDDNTILISSIIIS